MDKLIYKGTDVREKISTAVDRVSLPVVETIGPLGKNVLYESDKGTFNLTNDGKTIIRAISLEDPLENSVVEIIKDAAIRTDQEAGDGTSTTILFSLELIKKAFDLQANGASYRYVGELFSGVADKLLARLNKQKKVIKSEKTKLEIATISANNDKKIAEKVVEAVDVAGLDGIIYIEFNNNDKTVIEKQVGFRITPGMIWQNLYSDVARPMMAYKDIPVLILDKKLYYAEDAEHILRVAMDVGYKSIIIVAKDFLGDAPNTFIANHVRGTINVGLAKLDDDTALEDLAVYLGGSVVSEASGRRTDSINKDDFIVANKVAIDPNKILFTNIKDSPLLKKRIEGIKDELEKDKDNTKFKNRLASLTNGIVTLKVGGATQKDARERVYRFEDSINAVRAAMRDGYLIGGGVAMFNAFHTEDYNNEDEVDIALGLGQASLIRIAKNSNCKLEWKKIKGNVGLNALTGEYEDLLKAGVVEPYKVTEMALRNAVSVASIISSIGTFILNDYEESTDDRDK